MNYTIQFRYNGKEHILYRSFDREYKVSDSPIILNDLSYSQAVDFLKTEGLWLDDKSIEILRLYVFITIEQPKLIRNIRV